MMGQQRYDTDVNDDDYHHDHDDGDTVGRGFL